MAGPPSANWIQNLLASKKGQGPLPVAKPPKAVSPDKSGGPAKPVILAPITQKPPVKKPIKAKPKPRPKPKPKAKPKKPSALDKWLAGDTTYQQQQANFLKERGDYNSQYYRQQSILNRDYNQTQRQMNKQAADDRTQQANDFAGRGILHSGVYAKSLGDYNADFNTKLNNLLLGKTDSLGDLQRDRDNFMRQLGLDMQAAKQDAIRRRAQKLGL